MALPWPAALVGPYRQALTSAGYIGLAAVGLQTEHRWGWAASLGAISGLGLLAWASTYRRARSIADIATSRIGSAAQGYVEVVGRASGGRDELIVSPFSASPCVWYRYRVYSKDNNANEWRQTDSATSSATFELSDASGACRVDPDDAEVVAPLTRTTYSGDEKQVEELLLPGGLIYVLGELQTSGGAHTAMSASEDVGNLLAEWKKDRVRLLQRFDLDRSGEIDPREWELARRLATKTVDKEHREIRGRADDHTLRAPADGRPFLISTLAPAKLRQRYLWWSALHLGVALLGAGLLGWLGLA